MNGPTAAGVATQQRCCPHPPFPTHIYEGAHEPLRLLLLSYVGTDVQKHLCVLYSSPTCSPHLSRLPLLNFFSPSVVNFIFLDIRHHTLSFVVKNLI